MLNLLLSLPDFVLTPWLCCFLPCYCRTCPRAYPRTIYLSGDKNFYFNASDLVVIRFTFGFALGYIPGLYIYPGTIFFCLTPLILLLPDYLPGLSSGMPPGIILTWGRIFFKNSLSSYPVPIDLYEGMEQGEGDYVRR